MTDRSRQGWPRKDESLIERIDDLLFAAPIAPVWRKNFFGTVAWFLESNDLIFAGAWGKGVIVRLGEERVLGLIESGDADPHDPTGHRPKREYVFLDGTRITDDDLLLDWFSEASEFVGVLPPIVKKPRPNTGRTTGAGRSTMRS